MNIQIGNWINQQMMWLTVNEWMDDHIYNTKIDDCKKNESI